MKRLILLFKTLMLISFVLINLVFALVINVLCIFFPLRFLKDYSKYLFNLVKCEMEKLKQQEKEL